MWLSYFLERDIVKQMDRRRETDRQKVGEIQLERQTDRRRERLKHEAGKM